MRFKRSKPSQLPEVNLVPMLDVLMTVLTFFIVVSMTLALEQGVQVQLPSAQPDGSSSPQAKPLLVRLTSQGLTLDQQPIAKPALFQQMRSYLAETGKAGAIALSAAPEIPYEQVVQLLGELKEIGGDQVSLAIE